MSCEEPYSYEDCEGVQEEGGKLDMLTAKVLCRDTAGLLYYHCSLIVGLLRDRVRSGENDLLVLHF